MYRVSVKRPAVTGRLSYDIKEIWRLQRKVIRKGKEIKKGNPKKE
jgi:hypothetical protein